MNPNEGSPCGPDNMMVFAEITLRDYLAIHCSFQDATQWQVYDSDGNRRSRILNGAEARYAFADEMLRVRGEKS